MGILALPANAMQIRKPKDTPPGLARVTLLISDVFKTGETNAAAEARVVASIRAQLRGQNADLSPDVHIYDRDTEHYAIHIRPNGPPPLWPEWWISPLARGAL